ncbi:hypothetical protein [Cerasicoccus frondis]|uniref:hypothetical protein n=1 Tax=Cerasicoccus frondis TaxID=490090 RepID=UPI0028525F6B|nr:hypothetical protein [Cerasicoccus frondis]
MMKQLYLAWQDTGRSRAWYPIGCLERGEQSDYRFCYVKGAERAHREAEMEPLASFPDFHRCYRSKELFPLFKNRLIPRNREDFGQFIQSLNLPPDADDFEILSLTGGTRATDNFEMFPAFEPDADGMFRCRFFLHGWRHVNDVAQKRIPQLEEGQSLRVSVELNNPATQLAIQIQTSDYIMLGWTPRYLVRDLIDIVNEDNREICATVIKVNPNAPIRNRILIELRGKWPKCYQPLSNEDFHVIADLQGVS